MYVYHILHTYIVCSSSTYVVLGECVLKLKLKWFVFLVQYPFLVLQVLRYMYVHRYVPVYRCTTRIHVPSMNVQYRYTRVCSTYIHVCVHTCTCICMYVCTGNVMYMYTSVLPTYYRLYMYCSILSDFIFCVPVCLLWS